MQDPTTHAKIEWSGGVPVLSPHDLAALGRPSALYSAAHIALEWGLIVAASWLATRAGTVWVLLLLVPFIAARQMALGALAHEAAHGRLFPFGRGKDHWNLVLAEPTVAWPILMSTRAYRRAHLAHHRSLSTAGDPDWVRNRPDLWRPDVWRAQRCAARPTLFARAAHLFGFSRRQRGLLALFGGGGTRSDRVWTAARFATYGCAAACIHATGHWRIVALHWFLPLFTWFPVLMRARGFAEHWAVPDRGPLSATRTTLLSPLGRWLLLPKNIGYHLEHHLFPTAPFHVLPALHMRLMLDPRYQREAQVTRGVRALCTEFLGQPPCTARDPVIEAR